MFSFDNYYEFVFIALNLIFWPSYIYVFTTVVIREIERVRINKFLEEWEREENNECDDEEETEESMQQLQSDDLNLLDQENRLNQEQVNQERLMNLLNEQARSTMDKSNKET